MLEKSQQICVLHVVCNHDDDGHSVFTIDLECKWYEERNLKLQNLQICFPVSLS